MGFLFNSTKVTGVSEDWPVLIDWSVICILSVCQGAIGQELLANYGIWAGLICKVQSIFGGVIEVTPISLISSFAEGKLSLSVNFVIGNVVCRNTVIPLCYRVAVSSNPFYFMGVSL